MTELPHGVSKRGKALVRAADGAVFERRKSKRGDYLVNATADPIGWYVARGALTEDQASAARRLERDHRRAVSSPHAASRMDELRTAGGLRCAEPVRVGQIGPVQDALRALRWPARDVVWWVACWGCFANEAAERAGQAPRRGILLLRDGLDDLTAYYVARWARE